MSQSESEQERPNKERRFDPELLKKGLHCDLDQYDMLKRCSRNKNVNEWNKWLEKNHEEAIFLEGANLSGWNLKGVFLSQVWVETINLITPEKSKSFISGDVYLREAKIKDADLEKADFRSAHLENAKFNRTNLEKAKFQDAHLEGTIFYHAHLEGADVQTAMTDGVTSFWEIIVNRKTDFRGVSLDSCRIDARAKQLLEYNIRRMNWEDWYKEHGFWRWPVQAFWAMSDYGRSTLRVIGVFLILALLFAAVYMSWAYWSPPGIVYDLSVAPIAGEVAWHYGLRVAIRTIYFSVVTMTTLGFGDMYANKESIAGHVLLILQVILGYVLLGALVTRFAVLFTAGGPAGKFAEGEEKEILR
jgi:hypothetical protein